MDGQLLNLNTTPTLLIKATASTARRPFPVTPRQLLVTILVPPSTVVDQALLILFLDTPVISVEETFTLPKRKQTSGKALFMR